jgi:hypothetical protein
VARRRLLVGIAFLAAALIPAPGGVSRLKQWRRRRGPDCEAKRVRLAKPRVFAGSPARQPRWGAIAAQPGRADQYYFSEDRPLVDR